MADERVPAKWGKWIKRNPDSFQRGVEYGTPAPLVRGIRSRLKELLGPNKEELAQWQEQIRKMQEAGFVWDEQKNKWRRGDLFVNPWAIPERHPREEG